MATCGVVHGIFAARQVRDVKFWQFYGFFRTVFILILKVRCEFFSSFTKPFSFRTPAIMKIMEMKKSASRRRAT